MSRAGSAPCAAAAHGWPEPSNLHLLQQSQGKGSAAGSAPWGDAELGLGSGRAFESLWQLGPLCMARDPWCWVLCLGLGVVFSPEMKQRRNDPSEEMRDQD